MAGKLDEAATTLSYHVPLELKTGKMYHKQGSIDHRAQVCLFVCMSVCTWV